MAELIAQGGKTTDRWRRKLPLDETIILGSDANTWQVPWEKWLSRHHAAITWTGQRLRVVRLESASNPIFFRGKEVNAIELSAGDYFVLGGTTFRLSNSESVATPSHSDDVHARTISAYELNQLPFRDAPSRLDVLTRLPRVISSASDNAELYSQLVNLLLAGIPRADAVALVEVVPLEVGSPRVDVLHWDRRSPMEGRFEPSQRLILEAVGTVQDTVLHVMPAGGSRGPIPSNRRDFTMAGNFDWAFCTPVRGEACKGWGIYTTGRFNDQPGSTLLASWDQNELSDDLKFVELVASVLSSLSQVQALERRQSVLGQFFSPSVLRLLRQADAATALKPVETEVTVLFCDLRGFSGQVEAESENLLGILERVSKALDVMSQQILDNQGVVADFLGDAALGFWGWPIKDPETIQQACLAALGIRTFFEAQARRTDHPLAGFQVGIGLASGRAVAGRLGAHAQGKVTVFGPVVNLAARLETMTKLLHVPILMDEATTNVVREKMSPHMARCRRLARVLPYGLKSPVVVGELLPTEAEYPELTNDHLAHYEAAFDAFVAGNWKETMVHLHQLPPHDLGKDVMVGYIIRNNHRPPHNWAGVIPLESK